MFTPMIQILLYLSATFVLGFALGWLLWKFSNTEQADAQSTETEYWMDRLDQARNERDLLETKIAALSREKENLTKRLKAAG
ncbi:hypothetical protein [Yoonia sp. I 8.24]|uniref:hypothetical protein n=1 Tax=Yoonia sp. I 8.24 TaxID=1537229 RepID=UPI001EE1462C|nr:hypothetical protein [Yoonia sp. I 8.24]MCG3268342.1 hypothetical protein [Yoonia sp. I 8.24]